MKKIFLISIIALFSGETFSQISLGLVNGNYSGSNSLMINPSLMANSRLKADINLFSINAFEENNYLYFPARESSLIKLFNGAYDYRLYAKPYGDGERRVCSYYDNKSLKNIFENVRITGPSAMLSVHDHVFAVSTGFRAMSSTRRLPYNLANFSYYGMDFKPQHNVYFMDDNYDIASMAWGEVKFSYATVFNRSNNNHWSVGISAGPAFGYAGAYMSGGDTRYIAYNDSILNVEHLDAEFGLSLPVNYDADDVNYFDQVIKGYGWGMDIGVSWQYRDKPYQKRFPRNCYKRTFEDYKFRVGVSILDIGWVKFSKNAERHVYNNVSNNLINVNGMQYTNVGDQMNSLSELFYGDPDASLEGNSIKIFMPASLSVQIDYHLADWWYINGTLILPAKYASPMVERPMVLAVTPRFESRFLEVNLPLVLYDYKYPRVGLSVRIEGLTVGSDNLGGFLSYDDFTGADFYISYKVNLVNIGKNPYSARGACYNNWRSELRRTH